jgi:hypothetical protein
MNSSWLDLAKKRLQAEASEASDIPFDRLKAEGMINDRGEVTGQLHRWDAFLAITAVKRVAGQGLIEMFRCLKPVFGMPGGALIDVSRNSLVDYLSEGKRIITAIHDDRLDLWKEGHVVHLLAKGFISCSSVDGDQDDVGDLPEFQQSTSRL